MIVTLNSFPLSNGLDRCARVVGARDVSLSQDTPQVVPVRADAPRYFPARAVREYSLNFIVSMPPAADQAAAEAAAMAFIMDIPTGGRTADGDDGLIVTEDIGGTPVETTWAQWRLVSVGTIQVVGLSVAEFTVSIMATNPTSAPRPHLSWDGELLTWEAD